MAKIEILNKAIKIYPYSNVSVYNCSNCDFLDDCKAIRMHRNGFNGLRNYFCFNHSYWEGND